MPQWRLPLGGACAIDSSLGTGTGVNKFCQLHGVSPHRMAGGTDQKTKPTPHPEGGVNSAGVGTKSPASPATDPHGGTGMWLFCDSLHSKDPQTGREYLAVVSQFAEIQLNLVPASWRGGVHGKCPATTRSSKKDNQIHRRPRPNLQRKHAKDKTNDPGPRRPTAWCIKTNGYSNSRRNGHHLTLPPSSRSS